MSATTKDTKKLDRSKKLSELTVGDALELVDEIHDKSMEHLHNVMAEPTVAVLIQAALAMVPK
jgi:hypothetical protein